MVAFTVTSCARRVVTVSPNPQPNVVVIHKAPKHHKVVVVKGKRYYTWGGRHYRKTHRGYVLVKV
ncbi:MAG: hypothetical protein HKO54_04010 [Flavobacteriaceae bacterium]|nr:hypothetical protein [Flavobacteriaceae bacterium]